MSELIPSYLAITDGLHDGVEPTGGEIVDSLFEIPVPGVCPIRQMHPEAVRAGKRFMASKELGAHFTNRVAMADLAELDRDEIAARRFMDAPFPNFWLGIDPHDSPVANANSLLITERATTVMLGVAAILELENVVVLPEYPFLSYFPQFVSVETERAPESNRLSQVGYWRECLAKMVELGPEGMHRLGLDIHRGLKYYLKTELSRVDDDGKPDPAAIERIAKLEGIPAPGPYFTPFEPSHPVFTPALKRYEGRLCVGTWDDNNNGMRLPELGLRSDGRIRRAVFGGLLLRIDSIELVEDYANLGYTPATNEEM